MESQENSAFDNLGGFESRAKALRQRVGEAARVLSDQGIRPTVTRIRAALGGGSPNDLAPALKAWRESSEGIRGAGEGDSFSLSGDIPVPIADLAIELWHRATTAAAIELRGGSQARHSIVKTVETESLLHQITQLRDRLQRELIAFGELRAQAARHEAIARDAILRLDESEARERRSLRDLGTARQRVAEIEATLAQRREKLRASVRTRRKPKPAAPKKRATRSMPKLKSRGRPTAKRTHAQQKVPTVRLKTGKHQTPRLAQRRPRR